MKRAFPRLLIGLLIVAGLASSALYLSGLAPVRPDQLPMRAFDIAIHGDAMIAGLIALTLFTIGRLSDGSRALGLMLALSCVIVAVVLVRPDALPSWLRAFRSNPWTIAVATPLLIATPGFMAAAFARFAAAFPGPLSETDVRSWRTGTTDRRSIADRMLRYTFMPALSRGDQPSRFFSTAADHRAEMLAFFQSRSVWLLGVIPLVIAALATLLPADTLGSLSKLILAAVYAAVLLLIVAADAARLMVINFQLGSETDRRQMLWLLLGATVSVWIIAAGSVLAALAEQRGWANVESWMVMALPAAWLAFLAGIALSVFVRGAVDPRLAIQRTALYAVLSSAGLFAFAGLENIVTNLLTARLGLSQSIGAWIVGGTIALGLAPARSIVKKRIGSFNLSPLERE